MLPQSISEMASTPSSEAESIDSVDRFSESDCDAELAEYLY